MSEDFYRQLILPHADMIAKICRAYADTEEDFQDYYQEVCLQIWKSRSRFKEQCKWSTWVYRIALNVCLTMLKKNKKSMVMLTNISRDMMYTTESNKAFENEELNQLYKAIKCLSEVDRAIILLYLEEKTYSEIGEVIGMKESAIGARINRIKEKLKTLIYGEFN